MGVQHSLVNSGWLVSVLVFVTACLLAWWLFTTPTPPLERRLVDIRNRRLDGLGQHAIVARLGLALLASLGAAVGRVPLLGFHRRATDRLLARARHPWGLTADGLIGLSLFVGIGLALAYMGVARQLGLPALALGTIVVFILGYSLPSSRIRDRLETHIARVEAALPDALDNVVVSIEAGATLETSIATYVEAASGTPDEPIVVELDRLRGDSDRRGFREAWLRLAERVPSDEVRRLVDTVVEGELLGIPYGHSLSLARSRIRHRVSHRIETRLARTETAVLIPFLLILGATIVLIGGSFFVRGSTSGFFGGGS